MNLQLPVLPKPSKLYSLSPEGIGTSRTESLASYAMRLAAAHCIDVCNLIHLFINPIVGNAWKDTPARGFRKFHKAHKESVTPAHLHAGKWLDMTQETQATVAALSELTKRQDLEVLTLLPLSGYVQQETALRYRRTWCPCCYDEQREAGQPIHDLLLWSFKDVVTCPRHEEQILWSRCTWCAAKQPPLDYRSQPGYCSKCGQWLGKNRKHFARATYSDTWKAQVLGDLVGDFSALPKRQLARRPSIEEVLNANCKTGGRMKDWLAKLD